MGTITRAIALAVGYTLTGKSFLRSNSPCGMISSAYGSYSVTVFTRAHAVNALSATSDTHRAAFSR